jgi:hypothetical protein
MAPKKAKRKVRPRLLYHWSPRDRRGRILRHGLRIEQLNVITSEPHPRRGLCFCDDPARAWRLSADMGPRGSLWDLYLVYVRPDDKGKWQPHYEGCIPEYRIYNDIPKTHVLWIGECNSVG